MSVEHFSYLMFSLLENFVWNTRIRYQFLPQQNDVTFLQGSNPVYVYCDLTSGRQIRIRIANRIFLNPPSMISTTPLMKINCSEEVGLYCASLKCPLTGYLHGLSLSISFLRFCYCFIVFQK